MDKIQSEGQKVKGQSDGAQVIQVYFFFWKAFIF